MPSTGYDVIIGGVKAKISRSAEGGGYEERTVRAEISQQLISQQQDSSLAQRSRPDGASMYQTDWSGGSRWWKPLLSGEEINSYFISNNMDLWTEPGKVRPLNSETVVDIGLKTAWFRVGANLYAVNESDNSVDASHHDVAVWTPASNNFVDVAGLHSTLNVNASPIGTTYDASDGQVYIITSDGELNRFTIAGVESAAWITGQTFNQFGATIFTHQGSVWVYNGDTLSTVLKSGPSLTEQFDDGLGPDARGLVAVEAVLAVPTPEGIYYAKNVMQNNDVVAYVFRVDRDASGAYVGQPVATLPPGTVALDLIYHLGSLIISTTPDPQNVLPSGFDPHLGETILYYVNADTMGVLGSVEGPGTTDHSAFRLLGSDGPYVILGGRDDLWIYDAIGGGIHHLHEFASTRNDAKSFAVVEDSGGDHCWLIGNGSDGVLFKLKHEVDPDTVTAFGDDETYYTLESNYFDAGLPMENKQLNKVEILFDPGTETNDIPNQEWTVQISADDGAFTDVITSTDTGYDTLKGYAVGWADLTGRRFRYKLIYQTKTAVKLALRAIMATFVTGEMVREWHLTLDGTEFLNVDNEVITPRALLDSMRTVIGDEDVVPFINNFEDVEQNVQTDATPVYVKVQQASIVKSEPGESTIRVVLREDPYHST